MYFIEYCVIGVPFTGGIGEGRSACAQPVTAAAPKIKREQSFRISRIVHNKRDEPATRMAQSRPPTRFRDHRNRDGRAGDRSQHRDLHGGEWNPAAPASL